MSPRLRQSLLLLLAGLATSALAQESQVKSDVASSVNPQPGPEPRQISSNAQQNGLTSGSMGVAAYPYQALYQNAMMSANVPQTPSSGPSWLSILRPSQGGRRASLTSRLRNIIGSVFRRDQSPYMAQGSSLSYSLRPPPSGFFGSLGSGLGSVAGLGSGLSSLGSGYSAGSMGNGYSTGSMGSLGSQQNLFAAASGYQPMMIPAGSSGLSGISAGQLAQAGKWSSYKGASDEMSDAVAMQSSYNPSSNYGWASTGSNAAYPSYGQSAYTSGSGSGTGTYQSSVSSPQTYQAAASNYNPTATYTSSSSYPSTGSQYQRSSSSSSFKPIVSQSSSYSSGLVGSPSVQSSSYAAPSISKPVQSNSNVAGSSSVSSGSYSAQ